MALTYNRSSYTSTQLNTAITNAKSALGDMLPPALKEKSAGTYTSISAIEIAETSPYANGINTPEDAAEAIMTIARRDSFEASFNLDYTSEDYASGATTSFIVRTFDKNYAAGGTNAASFFFKSSDVVQARGPDFYLIGNSTTTGITTSTFSINRNNNSAGWATDNLLFQENFDVGGRDGWFRVSAAATLMVEDFGNAKSDEGSGQWDFGPDTKVGRSEAFNDGWPYVAPPSGGSTGDGDSDFNESLSSQCDGINQVFTLSNQYVSGTLRVYWNGQRQTTGDTIIEATASTFSTTFVPSSTDELMADYKIN